MSGSTFGENFRVTTFGESHGVALGVVIDGMQPNIELTEAMIQTELNRRRPGVSIAPNSELSAAGNTGHSAAGNTELSAAGTTEISAAVTSRKEPDCARILSGVFNGVTTGTPIAVIIENTDQHSGDYNALEHVFRPGHADYTFLAKYGVRDYRGGGRSSGRETAARVAAGAVAKLLLAQYGITVTAWTSEAAGIQCQTFDRDAIEHNTMRACDNEAAKEMEAKLAQLRAAGDTAGGIVCCTITGLPAGLGEPVFDKFDAELAKAIMSIGAVKGFELGAGFASARMTGTAWNDTFLPVEDQTSDTNSGRSGAAPAVAFKSNRAGGVLGGITTGADVMFRAAVKPVPSVAVTQQTVGDTGESTTVTVKGRHDVCLCPRMVPVIEAMAAITAADMLCRAFSLGSVGRSKR